MTNSNSNLFLSNKRKGSNDDDENENEECDAPVPIPASLLLKANDNPCVICLEAFVLSDNTMFCSSMMTISIRMFSYQ